MHNYYNFLIRKMMSQIYLIFEDIVQHPLPQFFIEKENSEDSVVENRIYFRYLKNSLFTVGY